MDEALGDGPRASFFGLRLQGQHALVGVALVCVGCLHDPLSGLDGRRRR